MRPFSKLRKRGLGLKVLEFGVPAFRVLRQETYILNPKH